MTSELKTTVYCGRDLIQNPDQSRVVRAMMADFYSVVSQENSVVQAGGSRALDYEYGPDVWYLVITDTKTGEPVAGAIWEYWDSHVTNCLSVNAALVLPKCRHSAVTSLLWRTIKRYAMGCKWICTTQYLGNCSYITKYREVKL